jgi:hypothetical protein
MESMGSIDMGRRTKQRIDAIFAKLQAEGKIDKPEPPRPRPLWLKSDPRNRCCVVLFGNKVQAGHFRQCFGCPLNLDEFRDRVGGSSGI